MYKRQLERYINPSTVVGVGSSDVMTTQYGVVLRAEFVRAGAATGAKGNPLRPLSFKVLPKGKADVPGILLGYPALDSHPHGLGWQPTEGSHYFSGLSLHMPRAELKKRSVHMEDLKNWYANDKAVPGSMGPEHCKMLCESAHSLPHEVSAVYDLSLIHI